MLLASRVCRLVARPGLCARSQGVACLSTSSPLSGDSVTHTGQDYSPDDPRNVRFEVTGLKKQVNSKWAIDLIAQVPVKKVTESIVCCDGGGGALGHPKIYINLDQPGAHSCNYCGLRFELDHHH